MYEKFKDKSLCIKNFFSNVRQNGVGDVIFMIMAAIPFFLTDFIIRFVINFMNVSDPKYYVVPILFDCFWVSGIVYFCYRILPKKAGKIVYACVYLIFSAWFLANYIYFCFFGQFLKLGHILLAGEGAAYLSDIINCIDAKVILTIALYIFMLWFLLKMWKTPKPVSKRRKFGFAILPFCLLLLLEGGIALDIKTQKSKGAWEIWDRPVLVYDVFSDSNKSLNVSGFYQYTFRSIYKEFTKKGAEYTREELRECNEFFESKANKPDNEMTGVLKDKNVIFVLLESIDDWVISKEYTPTIKYMMDNGINFTNHYMANMGCGFTFNAEFAMNTGFLCPSNLSSASVLTSNRFPFSLPNSFVSDGYNVNSFHFNNGDFYNRERMHSQFGYRQYVRTAEHMPYDDSTQDGLVMNNDEVYKRMTEGKFFSFYISYSAHLPYDMSDRVAKLRTEGAMERFPELVDNTMDEETLNIKLMARDTDEFFRLLIERLKADGLYEDTVIIGVADHYAYGIKNEENLNKYTLEAGSHLKEKVPFFIFSPSLEPRKVTKVTNPTDIVPTILNMFGMDKTYSLGNDAFDEDYSGYVFFHDGTWYDGKIHYTFNMDMTQYNEEETKYIESMNRMIVDRRRINDCIINSNYFKKGIKD